MIDIPMHRALNSALAAELRGLSPIDPREARTLCTDMLGVTSLSLSNQFAVHLVSPRVMRLTFKTVVVYVWLLLM